jgi:two-component system, NtrC family, sensor kinase
MRILIAEDDPVSRCLLEAKLAKWGYDAVVTCDGNEAWQALQAEDAPKLAILDWMMPGMDGVEICKRMRRQQKETYTYIILLTSLTMDEELVSGMEAGADDYIAKPFKANELEVRLRAGRRIIDLQNDLLNARDNIRDEAEELKNTTNALDRAYSDLKITQARMHQEEKLASLGRLAAGVAHEINTPIGFISSNLDTLEKYTKRITEYIAAQTEILDSLGDFVELAESRKRMKLEAILGDMPHLIEESRNGSRRIMDIVRNLKTFTRLDEAGWKFADINECLECTLGILGNELGNKAVLIREYGLLPEIMCHPGRLNQVFMNLLHNAAQAIDEHGTITVRTALEYGYVRVEITDTDHGIDDSIRDRIFEPFFTTREVGAGTGLGLSASYDIVKEHGGEISLESQAGEGATFIVLIPVDKCDFPHR